MRAVQIDLGARAGGVLQLRFNQSVPSFRKADPIRYSKLLLKMLPIHDLSEIHRQQPEHGMPGQFVRRQLAVHVPIQRFKRIIQIAVLIRHI